MCTTSWSTNAYRAHLVASWVVITIRVFWQDHGILITKQKEIQRTSFLAASDSLRRVSPYSNLESKHKIFVHQACTSLEGTSHMHRGGE